VEFSSSLIVIATMSFPFIPFSLQDTTKVWYYEALPRSGPGLQRIPWIASGFMGLKLLDFLLPSVFCLFASFGPCFGLQLCEAATSIKSGSSRKRIKPHNPVIMKERIFYLQRYFRSSRGKISSWNFKRSFLFWEKGVRSWSILYWYPALWHRIGFRHQIVDMA
jgi:hypothetical protein